MSSVETVSVLMTDLVGSTGLASRVGPVVADELRREHFGILRGAIEACSGDEIKSTGDGLMVVFRSAADAVACAVRIQQHMERRNRGSHEQLAIREGIALGDVTHEESDCYGVPVVEAARLCDEAIGGQILATELVRLIGGREGESFQSVGPLELRGFPEPVPVYEVGWEPTGGQRGQVPLPPRLRGVPPIAFVDRVRERDLVVSCHESARGGARRALFISGEPGIGKTRFATNAALEFHDQGSTVLFGRCATEIGTPYGAWIQALSHLVEHTSREALEAHVERHGGELARLVPAFRNRLPDAPPPRETDPETERYLLFSAVVGLIEQATRESPVVLLLDDLHWADRPTLVLLGHVLPESTDLPLLVLGTYRDSDLTRNHPLTSLLADLRREDGIERLQLRGLGLPEVVSILEAAAGHELDEGGRNLAEEIAAETDGNPFFVGEILRHLLESETLVQTAGGRWQLSRSLEELGLPQSVREVVGRRIERLGERCQSVLSCAAVIGREFDLELLARVVNIDEDELIDVLDVAVSASLLQESSERAGAFSFAHALINHMLYDEQGATRRARVHRRVAEAIEDLCGDDPGPRIAELARHWTAAMTPVDSDRAFMYSRQAAEQALADLAPDEAVRLYTQALELLDKGAPHDPAARCDLMIGLGEAQRQAGQRDYRGTLLDATRLAEELGDTDRMARAALANSRGFASAFGGVDDERVASLARAIEGDRSTNPARCARLISLLSMELQFEPDNTRRRALADEALELARTAGDRRILPYVLRDHFHATWSVDTIDARRRTAGEIASLANEVDDPLARVWALDRTVHVAVESGHVRHAMRTCRLLEALTDNLGQPGLRWASTYYAAGLAQMGGELEKADRLAEEAYVLGTQAGEPDALMIYAAQITSVRDGQGLTAEMVPMLEQAAEANPGIPSFQAGLAAALCDIGRRDDAASMLESAADRGFADVPRNQTYSTSLAMWARTAMEVRSERAAALLYDVIEPWRDLLVWNGATGYGSAESYLGMVASTLGSYERARDHFAAATALHEREGLKGWEALNLSYCARSLVSAGAVQDACEVARRALALARENHYLGSARRAEEILQLAPAT